MVCFILRAIKLSSHIIQSIYQFPALGLSHEKCFQKGVKTERWVEKEIDVKRIAIIMMECWKRLRQFGEWGNRTAGYFGDRNIISRYCSLSRGQYFPVTRFLFHRPWPFRVSNSEKLQTLRSATLYHSLSGVSFSILTSFPLYSIAAELQIKGVQIMSLYP